VTPLRPVERTISTRNPISRIILYLRRIYDEDDAYENKEPEENLFKAVMVHTVTMEDPDRLGDRELDRQKDWRVYMSYVGNFYIDQLYCVAGSKAP
jgi:hypothetical protein